MQARCGRFLKDEAGSISVIAIIGIVAFIGIAALAVDLGHLTLVKSDMTKAAEAGALAGARALDPLKGSQIPNFANAQVVARQAYQNNSLEHTSLGGYVSPDTNAFPDVETGYYDVTWTNGIPASPPAMGHLLGYANPEAYSATATGTQVPAVRVTLTKSPGGTGVASPVNAIFASILGVSGMNGYVSPVAIRPAPTTIAPGDAFPFAIPYTYVKQNWYLDPPVTFSVGSQQHDSSGGQWTTFQLTDNSASYVSGLITNGNQVAISVGDPIYIQTGEKGSIYNTTETKINTVPNKVYMVAVVPDGFQTGAWTKVKAFCAFKLTDCSGSGNDPYVSGQFVPTYIESRASGANGNYFGASLPPKLVN